MKKALFIVGTTSTGKTKLAVNIAKKIPSALISADSVQVYKGLDIISGKDHPKGTDIFLVDEVSPFEEFSVSNFEEKVRLIISENLNKIPIVVGGTGFYANSLFESIETMQIPPDEELRQRASKLTIEQLHKKLRKLNPKKLSSMNQSDINNPRRLIRAIEIEHQESMIDHSPSLFSKKEILFIGLFANRDLIKKRIRERVEKRIKLGAVSEAEGLLKIYKRLSSQVKSANGYRQLFEYLDGKGSFEEAKEKWITSEIQTAKKQMTWLKRNRNIIWLNSDDKDLENKALELVNKNFSI